MPALALLMPAWGIGRAQEKKEEAGKEAATSEVGKPKTPKGSSAQQVEKEIQPVVQGLGAFGQLLPLGRKNLDVQIPSFKDGIPSSILRAESLTRVDESLMTMEKMDIWLYGSNRDSDMRVQLPLADYNMTTQILSSDERSRISRQDFQMEGDSMIFDTVTQQGKMTGRVEMIIFNTSSLAGAKPEEAPAGATATATEEGQAAGSANASAAPATSTQPAPAGASNPSPSNEKK